MIGIDGEHLTLEIGQTVEPGDRLAVTVEEQQLKIEVKRTRQLDNGNYLVVAQSFDPLPDDASLPQSPGQRLHPRVPHRLRVMSPDIPDYQGMSLDFSVAGLQMEVSAPQPVGEILRLDLGLPTLGPDVPCLAEVIWCQPSFNEPNRHIMGCKFVNPTPHLRHALDTLLNPEKTADVEGRRPYQSALPPLQPPAPPAYEHATLVGELSRYQIGSEEAKVWIRLLSGETRELSFAIIHAMRDGRADHGNHIGILETEQNGSATIVRFLTAEHKLILELQTRAQSLDG